ncbi:MAG: methyl-accepting chemotaxis protein [Erysipelotrichia bacterium]|nr:methyl-accepting chemotaxis protein [Erysipelotrichia bacterium]
MSYLLLLFRHLSSWYGAILAAGSICFIGLVVYRQFKLEIIPLLAEIREANKKLRETKNAEEFAEKYEEIRTWLDEHPLFAPVWKEFSLNLMAPQQNSGDITIRNFHRASDYFSSANILSGKLNISLHKWYAGAMTGLGILGTFIGLVAGLYLAKDGLMADDPLKTRLALGSLLDGAALAFLTSIAGVFGSLLMNWGQKSYFHLLEQEVGIFNFLLEERLRFSSREELLYESLEQQKIQTDQMRYFNTDLAVSIASALDDRLASRMSPAIDRLLSAIESIRSDRSELGENVLSNVVEQFKESLSGTAGGELDRLAGTLRDLDGALQRTAGSIATGQDHINKTTLDIAESVKQALNSSGESMNEFFSKSMREFSDQIRGAASDSATELKGSGASVAAQLQQSVQEMTSLLKQSFEGVKDGLERIKGSSGEVAETMKVAMEKGGQSVQNQMALAMQRFSETMMQTSEKTSKEMTKAGSTLSDSLANASSDFVGGVKKLDLSISQLDGLARSGIAVQESLNTNIKALQDILMVIRQAATPLQESALAAKEASGHTKDASIEIKQWVSDCREISGSMTETTTNLQQAWENSISRFEGVDKSLKVVIEELIRGVEAYTQQIKKFHQELDIHLAKAIGDLGGVVNELGEQIGDLDEALRQK